MFSTLMACVKGPDWHSRHRVFSLSLSPWTWSLPFPQCTLLSQDCRGTRLTHSQRQDGATASLWRTSHSRSRVLSKSRQTQTYSRQSIKWRPLNLHTLSLFPVSLIHMQMVFWQVERCTGRGLLCADHFCRTYCLNDRAVYSLCKVKWICCR